MKGRKQKAWVDAVTVRTIEESCQKCAILLAIVINGEKINFEKEDGLILAM